MPTISKQTDGQSADGVPSSGLSEASGLDDLLREAARISNTLPASGRARLRAGQTLREQRLLVLREIGAGGMGAVFEVRDHERAENVALKLLTWPDAANVYRLKSEFRALSSIMHPNVVRLYELFCESEQWFFTMELVHGKPWNEWVRPDGNLDGERLHRAMHALLAALRAIHEAGKLHCDLKPANVLVTQDGRVVVLDFGLAVDSELGGVGQTISEHFLRGTPAYMAPEQAAGLPATAASDCYALGVMLFEVLTGQLPFEGGAGAVMAAKQYEHAPRPTDSGRSAAPRLEALCSALLSRDPLRRPGLETLSDFFAESPATISIATSEPHAHYEHQERVPLYGRSSELRILREALRDTLSGRAGVMVVRGESGVGKTALCEAFLRDVQAETGAVVLAARCYERESVPYKAIDPLIDALTRHLRKLPESVAAMLLPRDAFAISRLFPVFARIDVVSRVPVREVLDVQELQRLAFAALGELLARMRDRQPVIVHFDDFQWTDGDSLACLRQLFVHRESPPLLYLLSQRHETREGDGGTDEIARLIQAARDNPTFRVGTIEVGALDADASTLCVESMLGTRRPDLAGKIVREARGNAFVIRELCILTRSEGSLREDASVSALVARRVAAQEPTARMLLEILAIAGRPLRTAVALAAAGATYAAVDGLCESRLARGAASASLGGAKLLECYHDRTRESIADSLTSDRRRTLWSALASALLQTSDERDAELLCCSLEEGGDASAAAVHAAHAAGQAAAQLAFERAARLYRKALELVAHDATETVRLFQALGKALSNAGRGSEAAEAYRNASILAVGEHRLHLRQRAAEELSLAGHVEAGKALMREVGSEVDVQIPSTIPQALSSFVQRLAYLRLRGLRVSSPHPISSRDRLRLATARSAVWGAYGYQPLHAAAIASQYLMLALDAGDPSHLVRALGSNAAIHSLFWGMSDWVRTLLERMDALAESSREREMQAFACFSHGAVLAHAHEFLRARSHFARGMGAVQAAGIAGIGIDSFQIYDQICAFHHGDYADLVRSTPVWIEEAVRKGRLWTAALLSGASGAAAYLCQDRPDIFRRRLASAANELRSSESSWPAYWMMLGEAMLSIYDGEPARGYELLTARGGFEDAILKGKALQRLGILSQYRAQCAVSSLSDERCSSTRGKQPSWQHAATKRVAELRRVRSPEATAIAESLDAAMASLRGERNLAITRLRRATRMLDDAEIRMSAAATRRRLGQLVDGEEGKLLVAAAERFMNEQGVVNIEAMTELHCPGFGRG